MLHNIVGFHTWQRPVPPTTNYVPNDYKYHGKYSYCINTIFPLQILHLPILTFL